MLQHPTSKLKLSRIETSEWGGGGWGKGWGRVKSLQKGQYIYFKIWWVQNFKISQLARGYDLSSLSLASYIEDFNQEFRNISGITAEFMQG